MGFTIPTPDWPSAERLAEDPNMGFQMYTPEANAEVARVLTLLLQGAETTGASRDSVVIAVRAGMEAVARKFSEFRDTEPEWAVTNVVNAYFDTMGFAHISREDLF